VTKRQFEAMTEGAIERALPLCLIVEEAFSRKKVRYPDQVPAIDEWDVASLLLPAGWTRKSEWCAAKKVAFLSLQSMHLRGVLQRDKDGWFTKKEAA
jgi:hypothetical protein